jgi:predicted thioesterase
MHDDAIPPGEAVRVRVALDALETREVPAELRS